MYKYDHDCPFEAYITNLGKYNEGELVGEWVKFPTTPEIIEEVFKRIGIGELDEFGQPYEEWFITDYDIYVDCLYKLVGEYESIDELNFLASRLVEMTPMEYMRFIAIMDEGSYAVSLCDGINITYNLDAFEVLIDIDDEYDLGYYYIIEGGIYDLQHLDYMSDYIDYERFGRDIALEEGGVFTDYGYVCKKNTVREVYQEFKDIPVEFKLIGASSPILNKNQNSIVSLFEK